MNKILKAHQTGANRDMGYSCPFRSLPVWCAFFVLSGASVGCISEQDLIMWAAVLVKKWITPSVYSFSSQVCQLMRLPFNGRKYF